MRQRIPIYFTLLVVVLAVCFVAACSNSPTAPPTMRPVTSEITALNAGGYDATGYNRAARHFNGPADGVDRVLDGTYFGDPTFANDLLSMKWNTEWDRGNAEGWSNPPYAAHIDNHWNGRVPGGSGELWLYRIVWVGPCAPEGSVLPDGSQCIWGQFAIIMSQGTIANQHLWDVHARSTGFGS